MYRQNKNGTMSNVEINHVSKVNKYCFSEKNKVIQINSLCVVCYRYLLNQKIKCFSRIFKDKFNLELQFILYFCLN